MRILIACWCRRFGFSCPGRRGSERARPKARPFLDALSALSVDPFSLSMEERVVIKTPSPEAFPDKDRDKVREAGLSVASVGGGAAGNILKCADIARSK